MFTDSKCSFPSGIRFDPLTDKFDGPDDVYEKTISYPLSIVFATSHECNLNCEYCFRKMNRMPPPSTEKVLLFLKSLPVRRPLRLVLSGGEPFWREDIYEIIGFCAKQPWNVVIVSNGTYPIDFPLIPIDFRMEFSLDAPDSAIYTITRGGTRAQFEQLVANIRQATALGYHVRPCYLMSRVNTSKVIMRKIVEFSASLNVHQIRLQRFKPWGNGEKLADRYEFSQGEYIEICTFAREEAKRHEDLEVIVPQNNRFLALGSVYVNPDGSVSVQVDDTEHQQTIGNLYKRSLEEIWKECGEQFSEAHLRWLIRPKRLIK